MAEQPGEDLILIQRLRRGDTAAWAEVCARFGDALYRYAYHLTGGESSWAEDIRQETLMAAAAAVRRYRGDAPLFGWLCAIARRKAADELRRRSRMAEPVREEEESSAAWSRLDRDLLPEEWTERNERRAEIVEALGSLPPEYQRVLIARYADGMDMESLARRLGRSYKAVESLLSRARAALRHQLKEVGHG